MTTAIFDTLHIAKKAKEAGFTESEAEFFAEKLVDLLETQVATKQDLRDLEYKLIIKIGFMLTAVTGILATIIKLT